MQKKIRLVRRTEILYYRWWYLRYAAARRQSEREVIRAVKLLKQNRSA
jgi:hypothetical protein